MPQLTDRHFEIMTDQELAKNFSFEDKVEWYIGNDVETKIRMRKAINRIGIETRLTTFAIAAYSIFKLYHYLKKAS